MKKVDAYKCDHCDSLKLNPDDMREHEFMCRCNPETVQCITCKHCTQSCIGQFEEEYYSCKKELLSYEDLNGRGSSPGSHGWRRCKEYESWK